MILLNQRYVEQQDYQAESALKWTKVLVDHILADLDHIIFSHFLWEMV
jgi:hypothetical protein